MFNPAFATDNSDENLFAEMHANQFKTAWFYDPILLGHYPEYVVSELKKMELLPDWTSDELETINSAAKLNDFIGLNYYQPARVEKLGAEFEQREINRENSTGSPGNPSFDNVYRTVKMSDKRYTKWDWEISPDAFLSGLQMLKAQYGQIKIYITENGLGDEDPIVESEVCDIPRINFINDHLVAVKQAIDAGVNIKGYYAWSAIDILSWLNGYKKQYGFIYVDHANQLSRKKKASFHWYKQVIETRGANLKTEPETLK